MTAREEEYWSKFASSFESDQEYVAGKSAIRALVKRLQEERDLHEIIEFGCGTGRFTRAIANKARRVTATDLSDEMLAVARIRLRRLKNVTVQKADCYSTPFPSASFDTVLMVNLIHLVEKPHDALIESYRILRDGGTLLIASGTNYEAKEADVTKRAIRFLERFGMPPPHFKDRLSPDDLASLVVDAGFQVEEVQRIKSFLYLKCNKK
jgi:ubiquinone/menaquinone biosynthesis C-methylase UbiE